MELLKLVIVDDESIILRGLVETYDWNKMGFTIVGAASSGEMALSLIEEHQAEVVLTDIRMKKMTGLMLMEAVKQIREDVVFVVVSAYKDFEYAQKACEIGAFSYLVKPIEEDKLKETMSAVYTQCMKEKVRNKEHLNWKKLLLEDAGNFQEVIIERFVKDNLSVEELRHFMDMLGCDISEDQGFAAICVDADISYKITNQSEFEGQRFVLFQSVEKLLRHDYQVYSYKLEDGKRVFLLKIHDNNQRVKAVKEAMETISNRLDFEVISAISPVYMGIDGLKQAYQQVIKLFDLAMEAGARALTMEPNMKFQTEGGSYPQKLELKITNAVRKNDEKHLKEAYVEFIYAMPDKAEISRRYLHRLAVHLEFILSESYGYTKEIENSFLNFYNSYTGLISGKALDVFYKLLASAIETRKNDSQNQSGKYFSEYINVAVEYINHHLDDEELSITTVAAQIYLNPVYFGRIFKSTLHMSFKKYVLTARMDFAKKLITKGNESIATICAQVGIPNPSYFTQLFKQHTGMLPSDYKRDYGL